MFWSKQIKWPAWIQLEGKQTASRYGSSTHNVREELLVIVFENTAVTTTLNHTHTLKYTIQCPEIDR